MFELHDATWLVNLVQNERDGLEMLEIPSPAGCDVFEAVELHAMLRAPAVLVQWP